MNMRTVVSESARGAVLVADADEVLRQMLLPDAGIRGPAGVNGAYAGIDVGFENRVRMRTRPQIVRAVGDAGDASVQQRQHRQEIADIEVVRAVFDREVAVQRLHVFRQVGIRNDAAELVLPAMAVSIDDAGHDDHPAHLDGDCSAICCRVGEVGADRLDPAAADEHVALVEIPDLRVDRDDRCAFQEDPIARPGAIKTIPDRRPFRRGLLVIGSCPHGAPHLLDTGKR